MKELTREFYMENVREEPEKKGVSVQSPIVETNELLCLNKQ
jgi:hypothetical protein